MFFVYALDSDKISTRELDEQMSNNGYSLMNLADFKRHLKLHPQYIENSPQLYKIQGYYKKKESASSKKMKLNFPGYQTVVID